MAAGLLALVSTSVASLSWIMSALL
jgi:hypothetical protein